MIAQICMLLCGVLKIFTVYFAVIAGMYIWKKPEPWEPAPTKTRFAVVIAARNEEAVIGRLVRSLQAQDYPKDLYDVYVVPNNCTDDTAGVARRAGAAMISCTYPVRQKGDALRQAFMQLEKEKYDAYVVFDADNVVDRQFLEQMNRAFCAGAQVAKGRQMAVNPKESWVAGCYDLYFSIFDLLFNRPRANGKRSVKLVGTGFAVSREAMCALGGWNTETIAEDAEFAAICAEKGIAISWVPEAVCFDEEPCSFAVSLSQRKRWCSGVMQVAQRKVPSLLHGKMSRRRLDFLMFLLMPFAQAVSALLGTAAVATSLAEHGTGVLVSGLFGAALSYLCTAVFILVVARSQRSTARINLRSCLLFPLFMASWAPLQVVSLVCKTRIWRPMRHTGEKCQIDFA